MRRAVPALAAGDGADPSAILRIWMTESSNTCDTHGAAMRGIASAMRWMRFRPEIIRATESSSTLVKHVAGENQTVTLVSSIDPWHSEKDLNPRRYRPDWISFSRSGYTNHLPAMIPVSMVYGTPEDSAAELAYLRKRGYAISYVEMGEEPDGQYMLAGGLCGTVSAVGDGAAQSGSAITARRSGI